MHTGVRNEACLSMLLKNRDRVIESDEECVVFRKPNGHLQPLQAMEALVEALKEEGPIVLDSLQVDQVRTVTETFENGTLARKRFNELKKKP